MIKYWITNSWSVLFKKIKTYRFHAIDSTLHNIQNM